MTTGSHTTTIDKYEPYRDISGGQTAAIQTNFGANNEYNFKVESYTNNKVSSKSFIYFIVRLNSYISQTSKVVDNIDTWNSGTLLSMVY